MAITFDLLFNMASNEVTLSDTTDYTGYTTPVHGVVSIVSTTFGALNTPGTNLVPDITIASGDFSPAGQSSRNFLVTTGSPSPGTPFNGDWTVTYSIYDDAGQTGFAESAITKSFTFSFIGITAALSIVTSNTASQATSTDSTDYLNGGAYTLIAEAKTHSIYAPHGAVDAAGNAIPSPADTGSSSVITYTGITTGVWSSEITNIYTVGLNGGMGADKTHNVKNITQFDAYAEASSTVGLCNVYCCLKALNLRYEEAKCMNKSLAENYKNKIEDVTRLVTLYNQSVNCGLNADAEVYLLEIMNVSECNTECNCYGKDEGGGDERPPALIPITSSTSSKSYNLVAGSSDMVISSAGTGSSASPVVYNMKLGAGVSGDIAFIASNLNKSIDNIAIIKKSTTKIESKISTLSTGVNQQAYNVELNNSTTTATTTQLVSTTGIFNSAASTVYNNSGLANFLDMNNSFTVSNIYSSTLTNNLFSVTPTSHSNSRVSVQVTNKTTAGLGAFSFRLMDTETNQPLTNKELNNYTMLLNITFRIIIK